MRGLDACGTAPGPRSGCAVCACVSQRGGYATLTYGRPPRRFLLHPSRPTPARPREAQGASTRPQTARMSRILRALRGHITTDGGKLVSLWRWWSRHLKMMNPPPPPPFLSGEVRCVHLRPVHARRPGAAAGRAGRPPVLRPQLVGGAGAGGGVGFPHRACGFVPRGQVGARRAAARAEGRRFIPRRWCLTSGERSHGRRS